jgi:hypothetical protein
MQHRKMNPQGVYAGLAPAVLMMASRGPALDARRKPAAAIADTANRAGSDGIGAFEMSDTVKA